MRLYYTFCQALQYYKNEIERLEKWKAQEQDAEEKREIEAIILNLLERAVDLIGYAKPKELSPDLLDWFWNRIKTRPDLLEAEQNGTEQGGTRRFKRFGTERNGKEKK